MIVETGTKGEYNDMPPCGNSTASSTNPVKVKVACRGAGGLPEEESSAEEEDDEDIYRAAVAVLLCEADLAYNPVLHGTRRGPPRK